MGRASSFEVAFAVAGPGEHPLGDLVAEVMTPIGDGFRRMRLQRGFSLADAGQLVGLNASTVARAEEGLLTRRSLSRLARAYGEEETNELLRNVQEAYRL